MSLDEQSVIGNEGIRAVAGYRLSVFIAYWNYYLNLAIQHTSDVYVNSAINPPTVLTSQEIPADVLSNVIGWTEC